MTETDNMIYGVNDKIQQWVAKKKPPKTKFKIVKKYALFELEPVLIHCSLSMHVPENLTGRVRHHKLV